tara:strand:+ start:565 stop:1059 length:495 start_codon:yes stop_codon:yes gene_type:complete
MKNFKSTLIIFAIISLTSLTVATYAIYEINQVSNDTRFMIEKFDYDIDRIKSQPIANIEKSLATISTNRDLIKDMQKVNDKREELIACLWYQTLILNLNAPGNPKFNYYSEQYNSLLDSITPSEDKSQVINEINRYCETNEKLMQFLLDDKIKILIDKAAKNND